MWQTCFPKSRNNWGWWTTRLPPSSCLGTATRSWAEPKSIDTDTAIHLSGCTFVFSFVCTFVSTFQVAPLFSAAHNRRSLYLIFLLTRASYKKKKQLTGLSKWQKISFVTVWATQKHDSDITSDTLYLQLLCAFCLQIHLLPCNVCLLYFNFIFWLDVNIDIALSMFSSLVFQSFRICVFLVNKFKQTNKQTSD